MDTVIYGPLLVTSGYAMVSCYDCDRFGTECRGIIPPMEYRDRMDEYCRLFKAHTWQSELYKPSMSSRI